MSNEDTGGKSVVHACIGLGGNVGNVEATIASAFAALAGLPDTQLQCRSRLYRTPAWGVVAQPDFVNAAALLSTALSADELLAALLSMEREMGRDRHAAERWGPRVLDLDLLLYSDAIIERPGLQVPHPHLHERAFVLVPLAEIAPAVLVPGRGRVDALLAAIDTRGIEAIG